jgi:4-hydroxy-tetrahydrodipicolinate synthase
LQPAVLSEMCEAVLANDLAKGRELHDRLLEINKAVFYDTNPIPIKYMMMKLGLLAKNEHRLPMVPATPELAAKLDGVLERAGLDARPTPTRRSVPSGGDRRAVVAAAARRRAAAR